MNENNFEKKTAGSMDRAQKPVFIVFLGLCLPIPSGLRCCGGGGREGHPYNLSYRLCFRCSIERFMIRAPRPPHLVLVWPGDGRDGLAYIFSIGLFFFVPIRNSWY